MSSDAGGAIGGIVVGLAAIYAILYIIAILLTVGAILALIALGILSFFMAKSGRALVRQRDMLAGLAGAFAWAGALAVGLMLGSVGLFVALQYAFGGDFNAVWIEHYGEPSGPVSFALAMFDWIVADSYSFFLKVACVLYFANRVFVARLHGGWHWLGVAPPVFAFAVFFTAEHYALILQLLADWSSVNLAAVIEAALDEILLPVDLILMAIDDPQAVLQWCRDSLIATEGSFFKLGTYFPSLFCIVAITIAARHLFHSGEQLTG